MKDQVLKALNNIKEFWKNLAPTRKKIIIIAGGGVLAASIALVVFLNMAASKMAVLFPVLSSAETTSVCSALSEMGVVAEINPKGEILVPADKVGELQVQLAGKGFPQSATTYSVFLDNTGFTRTESEKRQIIIYQLQDNIRSSLVQSKGVKNAVVILTVPEQSGYVWEETKNESSASVTMTMESGYALTPERVSAIKNLVAFSVTPQMNPNSVKVIDASTGIEVLADDSALTANGIDFKRLEFEARVQKTIEDNIKRLLSPLYGADGVTAVAAVTLDYDKMLTQQHQVVPQDDGNGVKTHEEEQYTTNGQTPAEGLVGEEQNTDTPTYPNQDGTGVSGASDYYRSTDWENSYIKTQIEKGQAILKEATVSVIVKDGAFDEQKRDDLVNMISKAVNISAESISVNNYAVPDVPTTTEPTTIFTRDVLILIGAGALLLLIALVVLMVLLKRRKKKKQAKEEDEVERKMREQQEEIERHKRELTDNANSANDSKEVAIANEIRKFSKDNPEITANLIRSMMKEDE